MKVLICLLVILYLAQFGKWIVFIMLSPLYRRSKKRAKAKWQIDCDEYYNAQTANSQAVAAKVNTGG